MNAYCIPTYLNRAIAIQFEVVKPIKDWITPLPIAVATEFDIDAIADEVIGKSEDGYVRTVSVEQFWKIVTKHHIGGKGPKIFWGELFDVEGEVASLVQWSDDMGNFVEIDFEAIELSEEPDEAIVKSLVDRNGFELDDVTLYMV